MSFKSDGFSQVLFSKFALRNLANDHLRSQVVNCTAPTSNKATTHHIKKTNGVIPFWPRSDFEMQHFAHVTALLTKKKKKGLRHSTVRYNVWLWPPPLWSHCEPNGSRRNLSSQQVLRHRGQPPSLRASAAVGGLDRAPCSL